MLVKIPSCIECDICGMWLHSLCLNLTLIQFKSVVLNVKYFSICNCYYKDTFTFSQISNTELFMLHYFVSNKEIKFNTKTDLLLLVQNKLLQIILYF